ncbi:MAG: NADH-quinone oxidoreductase subunit NuoN [Rhodoferax sp.]
MIDQSSVIAVFPELILLIMGCVVALFDVAVKSKERWSTYALTMATLVFVAYLQAVDAVSGRVVYAFGGMVVSDPMGNWLKCFASVATITTLLYGRTYALDRGMLRTGDIFSLCIFALLGISVMISGGNLLVVYLGIELLTLSSYGLVALRRDSAISVEAAMKYFVLGALASGFLLYGMSMLYGATGTLDIQKIFQVTSSKQVDHRILVFGLVFLVAGLGFKLGVVPFHMWIPDVYQGAPTVVTLLIAGAPKLGGFAVAVRLLVEGLLPLAFDWQQMLAFLAVLSLLVGNFAAIMQRNVKRMLAYSTISHMGFLLIGLLSGVGSGQVDNASGAYSAAMFYVVTYVLTTLASFGVILILSKQGFECENLEDFSGLNQRSPFYAGVMALCLFSLAGVPPMVGFYAKFAVLEALVATGAGFAIALAVFAVLMSLIGAFFYLRLVKIMYFDEPVGDVPLVSPLDARVVLTVNALGLLLLGLLPGGLLQLCLDSVVAMLAG